MNSPGCDRADLAAALLIERMVRDAYPDRGPGAITALQWSILRALSREEPREKTGRWLTMFVGLGESTVSRSVAALQRRGLVVRNQSVRDKREGLLDLTDAGRQCLDEDPICSISNRIALLSMTERTLLRSVISKLVLENRAGA